MCCPPFVGNDSGLSNPGASTPLMVLLLSFGSVSVIVLSLWSVRVILMAVIGVCMVMGIPVDEASGLYWSIGVWHAYVVSVAMLMAFRAWWHACAFSRFVLTNGVSVVMRMVAAMMVVAMMSTVAMMGVIALVFIFLLLCDVYGELVGVLLVSFVFDEELVWYACWGECFGVGVVVFDGDVVWVCCL